MKRKILPAKINKNGMVKIRTHEKKIFKIMVVTQTEGWVRKDPFYCIFYTAFDE